MKNPFSPSKMWGDRQLVTIEGSAGVFESTIQLQEVSLPAAATCSLFFLVEYLNGGGSVWTVEVTFRFGLGRTNIPRTETFLNQPAPGVPLQFTIPAQPVETLQTQVRIAGNPLPRFDLAVSAHLAPITSIPGVLANESRFGEMPDMVDVVPLIEAQSEEEREDRGGEEEFPPGWERLREMQRHDPRYGTAVPADQFAPPMMPPRPARHRRRPW